VSQLQSSSLHIGLAILLLLPLSTSCSSDTPQPNVGGPCTYTEFQGKATVTELVQEQDSYDMKFDFALSDPQSTTKWLTPVGNHISIRNPNGATTSEWLTSQGVIIGADLSAIYSEIKSGTCSPSNFKFPTVLGLH